MIASCPYDVMNYQRRHGNSKLLNSILGQCLHVLHLIVVHASSTANIYSGHTGTSCLQLVFVLVDLHIGRIGQNPHSAQVVKYIFSISDKNEWETPTLIAQKSSGIRLPKMIPGLSGGMRKSQTSKGLCGKGTVVASQGTMFKEELRHRKKCPATNLKIKSKQSKPMEPGNYLLGQPS